ncbi:MAG: 50S ribosomal protein L6, partial [Hyphomicrobiaceae bacterium]
MSRIGKQPVAVPDKIAAAIDGQTVRVNGPKGELVFTCPDDVRVELVENGISISPVGTSKKARAMWGMSRTMVQNLLTGVTQGYT